MPTYEYVCEHCDHKFEKFQGMTEPRVKRCPKCSHKVRRLPGTGAGIIFKGSGFYQTDYRSAGYRKDAKKDASSASDSAKSGDKKVGEAGGKGKKADAVAQ